ncbi:MAG: cytochrome c oxidase accessory protein CcoG [Pseudomonadota bacterium]
MNRRSTIIPIIPAGVVSAVERPTKVQARSTQGRFTRWRTAMLWATQLFFFGMPWLQWNGRQMVRFDLEAERFYLGGLVLLPQDLIFLTGLLLLSALLLFFVTSVAGRVWCGFACPQTVYTSLFMRIERFFEGERHQRLRLDAAPWNADKLLRRGGKLLAWTLVSLWTGLTFVGWFSPMRELTHGLLSLSIGPSEGFWALFYGAACLGNAGFLREKVCHHMCPYGRFQGALMDADTLIVAYDARRGEPRRGTAKAAPAQDAAAPGGDCVDCTVCVQVCPVGIDIRNGLQATCIGCGLCIDACDTVMDKLHRPRGLIRLATQRELGAAPAAASATADALPHAAAAASQPAVRPAPWRRWRVQVYGGLLLLVAGFMAVSLLSRPTVQLDVAHDRGVLARLVDDGAVENVYRLQLTNQSEAGQRLELSIEGLDGAKPVTSAPLSLKPLEARTVALAVRLPAEQALALAGRSAPLVFRVTSHAQPHGPADALPDARQGRSTVAVRGVFHVPR